VKAIAGRRLMLPLPCALAFLPQCRLGAPQCRLGAPQCRLGAPWRLVAMVHDGRAHAVSSRSKTDAVDGEGAETRMVQ
jgi:hypothetical protein